MSDRRRLEALDELRGAAIVLVVLYHLGYDLNVLFGVKMDWFWWDWPVQGARDCFTGMLMALSGLSCSLSHSNLRRGARLLGIALALTAATLLFAPSQAIVFGVLHYYGTCMLLWALLGRWITKIPTESGILIAAALFFLLRFLSEGFLLVPFIGRVALPGALYQSRWLFWLGLPHPGFSSADYYPLLPWGMLFIIGGLLGARWRRQGFPPSLYPSRFAALAVVGRHALCIYLIHQPVLIGLLWLVFR